MAYQSGQNGLQLRSLVKDSGELELSLVSIPTPKPAADEVVVRIEGSPINPSDLGLLLSAADVANLTATQSEGRPVVTGKMPQSALRSLAARLGQSLPVGNEGAGTVVEAGDSSAAQSLLGKTVAAWGGAMYSQYRCVKLDACLPLPADATAADGASSFVNPMTSLGMVETMRTEGHKALVHTAAASNLGQMLNKICLKDGIGLVNIVRDARQEALLRELGARYVCNSASANFEEELTEAVAATGATLAFDAIGGGLLASQILTAMETAAVRSAKVYSRYGSSAHKQVYIYGSLDTRPTELRRGYGMAWGLGGWLLTPFLTKIGAGGQERLRQRVVSELKTTFASRYTRTISLAEALDIPTIQAYAKRATGEKFLLDPNK
jgi:NADPH:quinone reductase-like Zn-dependent oxidoreductase